MRIIRKPKANELVGDPLLGAVESLLDASPTGVWCGNYADLLDELSEYASEAVRRNLNFWPAAGNGLGRRLIFLEHGLTARGIVVNRRNSYGCAVCLARQTVRAAAA